MIKNMGASIMACWPRKIFSLTYKTNDLTGDSRYKLPDQIAFSSCLSCVEDKETKAWIVFGSKSYQSKLKLKLTWRHRVFTPTLSKTSMPGRI